MVSRLRRGGVLREWRESFHRPDIHLAGRWLKQVLFGAPCPFCGEELPFGGYFHNGCPQVKLNFYRDERAVSVCEYDDSSRRYVMAAKERADGLMMEAASELLLRAIEESGIIDGADALAAVPPTRSSLRRRGYNFPLVMAKEIAALAKLRLIILPAAREHGEQKLLSAENRRDNLKGAFMPPRENIAGLTVILIDDVITTGATLAECGEALRSAGAKEVRFAAFAAVRGNSDISENKQTEENCHENQHQGTILHASDA